MEEEEEQERRVGDSVFMNHEHNFTRNPFSLTHLVYIRSIKISSWCNVYFEVKGEERRGGAHIFLEHPGHGILSKPV